jgi:hypothetical protein
MRKVTTFLIIAISIYLCQTIIIAGEKKIELNKDQIKTLKNFESQGFLVLKPALNTAYIHPDLWAQINIMRKENLAIAIAVYNGNEIGDYEYYVKIYDLMSGKKLAKYGFGSFKVY